MNLVTLNGGQAVTMSSLELVDFINAHRKAQAEEAGTAFPSKEFAELAHADFMKKVPIVLGGVSENFPRPTAYNNEKTGMACIKPYCHVTPKGLAKLAMLLGLALPGNDLIGKDAA